MTHGAASSRVLSFDFPEFTVGTAEYPNGPTGCTVFYFPKGAIGAVDVRGGAAAVREESSISPLNSSGWVDAVFLAGGSTYGLDVGSGVMSELLQLRGGQTRFDLIPAVPGAIVYDFSGRTNSVYPDAALGAEAFRGAKANEVKIGKAGGGANVSVGKYFGRAFAESSGQGAAFVSLGPIKVFALTVVNAVGNVLNREGKILAGSLDPKTQQRVSIPEKVISGHPLSASSVPGGNTTVSILITNAKVDRPTLQRIAVMAHTAMARVIEPFHTQDDGDTLFAVTTRSTDLPQNFDSSDLGVAAGRLMQDAVMEAVK